MNGYTGIAIAGYDINFIELAYFESNKIVKSRKVQSEPEEFLKAIDDALNEWNVSIDTLEAIAIVEGPGSFTASRLSVTFANTIAWSKKMKLFSIPLIKGADNQFELNQLLNLETEKEVLSPVYDRPPRITIKNEK